MRDPRIQHTRSRIPKGSVRYEELLQLRIHLGRRRIDMLCHPEALETRQALALHRQCVVLDELLGEEPRYQLDRDLRVLTAEEPRFHTWPQLPLDHENEPCRACRRLQAGITAELVLPPAPRPAWGVNSPTRGRLAQDAEGPVPPRSVGGGTGPTQGA
jgi:hypothetical protein